MKRLEFLREKFNVLPQDEFINTLLGNPIYAMHEEQIKSGGYLTYIDTETKTKVLSEDTFNKIVNTDPTKNKIYTQWLLRISTKLINGLNTSLFDRFITEDLDKTKDDLILFDGNKRKKKFKEMAANNYAVKHLTDPTNINQYEDLQQLSSVTYPFKEVQDISELEGQLEYMVSLGEAEIPVKDEKYTIFIPKTLRASELFNFTSWCTARAGNSMFNHYRKNLKPCGNHSDLYIIIENSFFSGHSDNLYQIHFESSQIMDKTDKRFKGLTAEIFPNSIGVRNFFNEELKSLTKSSFDNFVNKNGGTSINFSNSNDKYLKHVLELGFGDILFDILDEDITSISYEGIVINELPSLSKFKNLRTIYLDDVNMNLLHKDTFVSEKLEMLSIPRNNVKSIPGEISKCKNLKFINLIGNPIEEIPESIKYLDPSNGGSLFRFNLPKTFEHRERIATLLPSVVVGYN